MNDEILDPEYLPFANDLVTKLPYAESELRIKVYEAISASTICWEDLSEAGIFKSEKAVSIGDELLRHIIRLTNMGEANLGCATTEELRTELDVRTTIGHTDPDYKTID